MIAAKNRRAMSTANAVNDNQARCICNMVLSGFITVEQAAVKFNLSESHVQKIVSGQRHKKATAQIRQGHSW